MELIFHYFWLLCILATCANAAIWWTKGKTYMARNPELLPGYRSLTHGFAFWGNIPWLVMGFGSTVGHVPSLSYYFRPQDRNPYVLAWFLFVIVLWIIGFYWLFF